MKNVVMLIGGACSGKTTVYKRVVELMKDYEGFRHASIDWGKWCVNRADRKELYREWLLSEGKTFFIEGTMCVRGVFEVMCEELLGKLTVVFVWQTAEQSLKNLKVRRKNAIKRNLFGCGNKFSLDIPRHRINAGTGDPCLKDIELFGILYPHDLIKIENKDFKNQEEIFQSVVGAISNK